MCGIAGKVYADRHRQVEEGLLRAMCQAMVHRGPDDEGYYLKGQVGLGMRRLEVIDLEGGHQPMANEDESLWIVFNGEIYNHVALRQELEEKGHRFRTAADTEAILHLYEEDGLDCLQRLRGMFALALWDVASRTLVLARDRIGKKPLFYAQLPGALSFASELGPLLHDPHIDRELDLHAIDEYLSYLFIPHPRTIYRSIRKLPPASWAVYRDGQLRVERYWNVEYRPASRRRRPEANLEELDALLREAVRLRLAADVPVGAFLSGGLDSSLVVALMQQEGGGPVRTFSIGFEESSYDELAHARQVARYLGTEHQECVVRYQVQELLPRLLAHFGEPFADSSAIPTYHLARMTRSGVTVALSGDGGDEVFGGYRRYQARRLAGVYNRWPGVLGRGVVDRIGRQVREPATYYGTSLVKKFKRFAEFAAALREAPETSWGFFFTRREKADLYAENFADVLRGNPETPSLQPYFRAQGHAGSQAMLWADLMTYLPDDILAKVDRMSMACSLETRAPLLDHRVVEFMAQVPADQKCTLRHSKRLLRRLGARYLPGVVLARPKQGFAIPLNRWLQHELRAWMEEVLRSPECRERGLFRPAAVEGMIAQHIQGRRDYSQQLWALLVLESWFLLTRAGYRG
jgi:asparagine synthase (glutamine-hydrolysing)